MRRNKGNLLGYDDDEIHANRQAKKAERYSKKKIKTFVKKLKMELKKKFAGYEEGDSGNEGGSNVEFVLDNLLAETSWW